MWSVLFVLAGADSVSRIANDYWDLAMAYSPLTASAVGDHRHDSRLDDRSPAAADAHHAALRKLRARAQKMTTDVLNRDALIEDIDNTLAVAEVCRYAEWRVDHIEGVQFLLADTLSNYDLDNPAELAAARARLAQAPRFLAQHEANLRAGLRAGMVASTINIERSIAQLDRMSEDSFAPMQQDVRHTVLPALVRYRAFLHDTLLPASRHTPGLVGLPLGPACYLAELRRHTGLSMRPADVHALGISEAARIGAQMQGVIAKVTQQELSPRAAAKWLAKKAPASKEALLADAERLLARADEALPRAFSRLPRRPLVVEAYEQVDAAESAAAFYAPPPMGTEMPGRYMVNLFLYDHVHSEAQAYHEGLPGHHLQVALTHELPDIPKFRRFGEHTAFCEGWALYAEKLATELGLYSSDAAELGRLSAENVRAVRLIVDTGLHVYGWSRERAVQTLLEATAAPRVEIENEVDRYITWPGQAVAYKIGELEILRLRRLAERVHGARFDLKRFHSLILDNGPLPLGLLSSSVTQAILSAR